MTPTESAWIAHRSTRAVWNTISNVSGSIVAQRVVTALRHQKIRRSRTRVSGVYLLRACPAIHPDRAGAIGSPGCAYLVAENARPAAELLPETTSRLSVGMNASPVNVPFCDATGQELKVTLQL